MSDGMMKWQSRPLIAGALRLLVLLVPIALSVALVTFLGRRFPRPSGLALTFGWWLALSAVATVSLVLMDRVFRKFLPLVALLKLTLVFPDKAPSRFTTALRAGTVRQLKRRMESGEFSDSAPQEAAEQLVGLASALNAHDRLTRGHTERVRAYSVMIGEELGLSDHELELLNWSGLVHDIGKLTVPTEILNKPGKPSDEEWKILRNHPHEADALIAPLRPWLGDWAESATQHHERFDGKGYPKGLAGHDITLAGRIVAIADAYDVMTSSRSYKKPMPAADARKELAVNAGGQFDPDLVRSFLRVSIGRLQLVAGPLGSILQLPAGSASVGTVAATGASTLATIAVAGATGLLAPTPELALEIPQTIAMIEEQPVASTETDALRAPSLVVQGLEDNTLSLDLGDLLAPVGVTIELVGTPDEGAVDISEEGHVTLVPSLNFNGSIKQAYTICFPDNTCENGVFTFEVEPVNDLPQALDDAVVLDEDEVELFDVISNDSDVDGDALVVSAVRLLSEPGTLLGLDILEIDGAAVKVRGLPDQSGDAVVEYTISDQAGASAVARLTVDIAAVNDAPVARNDVFELVENTPETLDVLGNDSDIENESLQVASLDRVVGGVATTNGDTIRFSPEASYQGPASLRYFVQDESGGRSSATVALSVIDDPARPALQADSATTNEDQAVVVDVLANDSTNGVALVPAGLSIYAQPTNGSVSVQSAAVLYTPDFNWSGTDSFSYWVCDVQAFCGTRTATVIVNAVNDVPSFSMGANVVATEDAAQQSWPGWATDIVAGPGDESDQGLSFLVTASVPGLFSTQPTLSPSGELRFTPSPDANGASAISVFLTDSGIDGAGAQTTALAQAIINITPQNDAPQFVVGANPTVVEDAGSVTLSGWASSISAGPADESGQTLTFEVTPSNSSLFAVQPTLDPAGELTFTPTAEASGTSSLSLVLVDNGGVSSGGVDRSVPVAVTITVTAQNDAPVANDDSGTGYATILDVVFTTPNVLANDFDIDSVIATSTVDVVAGPATGTLTNNGDGTFDFLPAVGWTGTETFTYTATDTSGFLSDTATVSIVVEAGPVADAGGPYAILEGGSLTLDGSASIGAGGSWNWDLDNDGLYDDATGQSPTVSWAALVALGVDDDGTYAVGVEVAAGADTDAVSLVISNVAPLLSTSGAASANVGVPYTLNLGVVDPGEDTVSTWTINWGDGSVEVVAGNPASVTHTYISSGFTFDVLVSATDEDGTVLQNELLVPSYDGDAFFRYAASSGAFLQTVAATTSPIEAIIGPDGQLYVSGDDSDNVLRFDAVSGAPLGEFVAAGSGGLNNAEGMAFGPDGHLYVANYTGNNVLRFNGTTGAFIDVFTSGITRPYDLVFGPDSNLYVGSYTAHRVLRVNGVTGVSMGVFVSAGAGGLDTPEQMAFGPDANLYVTSFGSDQVMRYNGSTGAFIDVFVAAGGAGDLDKPSGLAFGPDGHLYLADHVDDVILRYDAATGIFIDEYVTSGSGGLTKPGPMTFLATTRVLVNP